MRGRRAITKKGGVEHGHGGGDAPHCCHARCLRHTHSLSNERKLERSKHIKDGFYEF